MQFINLHITYVLSLVASIITSVVGQFFFKKGAAELQDQGNIVIAIISSKSLISGFLLYTISAIFYIFSLKKIPLTAAYPSISISYILIMLLGHFFFGEVITINKIIGVFLIFSGVIFVWR